MDETSFCTTSNTCIGGKEAFYHWAREGLFVVSLPHQSINQMFSSVTHLTDEIFFLKATVLGGFPRIKLPSFILCEEISYILCAVLPVNPHIWLYNIGSIVLPA